MPKAYIKTYGCQMNEQDSLQMRGLLSRMGYSMALDLADADLILINSCSIREKAVQKIYSDLGRVRPYAEENPNLIVGLAGCVAQQEKDKLAKRFPFLDMVFGPDAIRHLPEMVAEIQKSKFEGHQKQIVKTHFDSRQDFAFVNLIPQDSENRVKAFVNIQKGCDNVCAFCVVPRVRGAEVSRPSSEIISEIKQLVDLGVKETTLLGQNVNSYGFKKPGELTFAQLLTKIARETTLSRLRFTTSHPKDVGDDLVACYRDLKMLCSHLHLPVQSGSNRILESMRRGYTREDYLGLIDKLKKVRDDLVFSTDIIVGFPGETDKDFCETLNLMKEVSFEMSFTFIYSPRPGTQALKLVDDIPIKEKEARLEVLMDLQREIALGRHQKLMGTTQEVLVESCDDLGQTLNGRTGTNKICHMPFDEKTQGTKAEEWVGKFVNFKVTRANPFSLMGELV